jgi:hypothetical protein
MRTKLSELPDVRLFSAAPGPDGALEGTVVTSSWSDSLDKDREIAEAAKPTKLGELWVPALFELWVIEYDPKHPPPGEDPQLVVILRYEVVDERMELRGLISDPLEVPEALDYLRKRRPLNEWKRYALITLAGGQADAALDTSDFPKGERGKIVGEAMRRAGEVSMAQRRNRITPEHLEKVAGVYREAWRAGEHPTIAVEKHFGVSHSTAARWVGQARRAGHLRPPAEGSRGGEETA